MAQTDLTQLKHTIASQLHLYYEPQPDGTNMLRHIRVNQRTYNVPSEGITIDDLPGDIIGSEHIKDDSVQERDLSQQLKGSILKTTDKGVSGGIATLGDDGKVPASQLPETAVATEEDVRGIVSNYTE